jgi:hypothetical protein
MSCSVNCSRFSQSARMLVRENSQLVSGVWGAAGAGTAAVSGAVCGVCALLLLRPSVNVAQGVTGPQRPGGSSGVTFARRAAAATPRPSVGRR